MKFLKNEKVFAVLAPGDVQVGVIKEVLSDGGYRVSLPCSEIVLTRGQISPLKLGGRTPLFPEVVAKVLSRAGSK